MTTADLLVAALQSKAGAAFRHQSTSVAWRSAGLVGERHDLSLIFDDDAAAARLLDGLADHEFDIGASFVADIVAGPSMFEDGVLRVRLEALTLDAN